MGGVWTYALELARALQEYNIEVYLATMGDRLSSSQWEASHRVSNLTIKESSFDLEWMDEPWDEVNKAGEWLLDLEQQIKPDLIHLNNYVHGSLPWDAPVLMVGHSCVLSWWEAVKNEEAPDRWNTYAERVTRGLQGADCVVGVTQNMLDSLENFYGPFEYSTVVYNARDKSRFSSSAKKPQIFSMGRLWDEAKNIASLQAIADRLSWPVYIAGEEEGYDSMPTENVHFLGRLSSSEVAGWLGSSSIFVMPARYEPFGLSALEAASSGCSLVLGDIPTLREVWEDAAMFADPDDTHGMYHQIQALIKNAAKRQHMSKKARQRAERYSTDRFGRQYTDLYQQLLYEPNRVVAE